MVALLGSKTLNSLAVFVLPRAQLAIRLELLCYSRQKRTCTCWLGRPEKKEIIRCIT